MTSIFAVDHNNIHNKPITTQYLYSLHKLGFKPVALSEGHIPEEWTPIYDNPNYWQDKNFYDQKIYSKFNI